MIPFIKIGNKYFHNNIISDDLPPLENEKYISIYFEKSFLLRNDIVYLPCIIQGYDYTTKLGDYHNILLYKTVTQKFKNNIKSLYICKIKNQDILSFIDINDAKEYYKEVKSAIDYVVENNPLPKDYEYIKCAYVLSELIALNKIKYEEKYVNIKYNPFTNYGRFGTHPDSFNILSLKKDKRKYLTAEQDYTLFEFDYNAFEVRTLFAILGINQPEEDLYKKLHDASGDTRSRDEFKSSLLSCLFSQNESKTILHKVLQAKDFYGKYPIINGYVENIFGKKMDSDQYHLMSRILQSTSAYIMFAQMLKIALFLCLYKYKSKILFSIHDAVCIAIHKDETEIVELIKEIFTDVQIKSINYKSTFQCKIKCGKNYGEMSIYET
jgi:hypothetical protein